MDDTGDIPQERQENIEPEMKTQTDLQKYPQWGKQDRNNYS